MDLVLIREAELLLSLLAKIKRDQGLITGKKKVYNEKEILSIISDDLRLNFKMFIKTFTSSSIDSFLIDSCMFSLNLLISQKDLHWAAAEKVFNDLGRIIIEQGKKSSFKVEVDLNMIKSVQGRWFEGNYLGYDKEGVDGVVVEAFIRSLGVYNGQDITGCIDFEWKKEVFMGKSLFLVPGLVLKGFDKVPNGNYRCVHFNER